MQRRSLKERTRQAVRKPCWLSVKRTIIKAYCSLQTREIMKTRHGIFTFSSVKYIHTHIDTDVHEYVQAPMNLRHNYFCSLKESGFH